MRVLQVNDYATRGGAEVHMHQVAALLAARGHEVRVFTGDQAGLTRSAVTYVNHRGARRALRQALDEFQPDVVHFHNIYHLLSPGVLAEAGRWRQARGRTVRIVFTAHDYHLVCPNSGLSEFRDGTMRTAETANLRSAGYLLTRRWDRRGVMHSTLKVAQHVWSYRFRHVERAIDTVIAPCRYLRELVQARGLPATWLPYPMPMAERGAAGRKAGRSGDVLSLVFAGRLEPEKGMAEFIAALPADFRGRLTVVGEGSEMDRIRHVIEAGPHMDRIALVGSLPHDAAVKVIADAHVLVMPSLWVENSPLALAEALVMGVNILVADHAPLREIMMDAGVGESFVPGDAASLKSALDRFQKQHENGTLNAFDAGPFIALRSPQAYIERLERVYRGQPGEAPDRLQSPDGGNST